MPSLPFPAAAAELLGILTWALFFGGVGLVIASWAGRIANRFGWVGAWMTVTGAAMSWAGPPLVRAGILTAGALIVAVQLSPRLRPRRASRGMWRPRRRRSFHPWDQEAELLQLCHGDKAVVERLIRHEIERNPKLSRAGAALSASTRLRHEK